jgi:hypothetical protein
LDRMAACGAVGRGFESLWVRLFLKKRSKIWTRWLLTEGFSIK